MKLTLEQIKLLPQGMAVKGGIKLDISRYGIGCFENINSIDIERFFDKEAPSINIPLEEYDYGVRIEDIAEVMEYLQPWGEPRLDIDRILVDYSMGAEDLILTKLMQQ